MIQKIHVIKLSIITLTLLATSAAAYFSFSWSRREEINSLQQSVNERMSLFSSKFFASTDKFSYLPKVTSRHSILADALINSEDAKIVQKANNFLKRLSNDAGSIVIYLLNPQGFVIASSNWDEQTSFIGNNYAFRPYFVDAINNVDGKFYAMGLASKTPGYYVSSSIKNGSTPIGVVAIKIDLSSLNKSWEKTTNKMIVTDNNGIIFLSSEPDWTYRPIAPLPASVIEKIKLNRQYENVLKEPLVIELDETLRPNEKIISIAEMQPNTNHVDRVSYFMQSKMIADSDWHIHIFTPLKDVDARAKRDAIIGACALLLLSLTFLYFNQVRIRRKDQKISQKALEIQNLELQEVNEKLRIQSVTDPLTGIFNRRFFLESTAKLISTSNRYNQPLSILLIDIDNFKRINDIYGHFAGDKVLQSIANMYKEELRDGDIFARYGGEEFIIAFPYTNDQAAKIVAERVRVKIMNHLIQVDNDQVSVTVSSGISQHRPTETNIQDIIKRADVALYKAKRNGRNRVFTQSDSV